MKMQMNAPMKCQKSAEHMFDEHYVLCALVVRLTCNCNGIADKY